jgi:hypothetical protein
LVVSSLLNWERHLCGGAPLPTPLYNRETLALAIN